MRDCGVDRERLLKMRAEHFASRAGRFLGDFEMMTSRAEPNRFRGAAAKFFRKKTGRRK